MTAKLFNKLWLDALDQPDKDLYIGEYGYPDWFDEISADAGEIISTLESVHDVAHMTVPEIQKRFGLGNAAFARRFCIPLRTLENWIYDKTDCPDYIRLMMARELGIMKIKVE